jgi:hypothetical protein
MALDPENTGAYLGKAELSVRQHDTNAARPWLEQAKIFCDKEDDEEEKEELQEKIARLDRSLDWLEKQGEAHSSGRARG